MKASSARQKVSGPSATSMKGRRRPIGVWNVSLHGPITSGSVSANTPSAASTSAISVVEPVKRSSSGGRYAAVVVSDQAKPRAPTPSSAVRARAELLLGGVACDEPAADDVDDRALCTRNLLVPVRKRAEHPAGQDLLQPSIEDPAREPWVHVLAQLAGPLPLLDHPLDGEKGLADVFDLPEEVLAARDLTHHDRDEVGVVAP